MHSFIPCGFSPIPCEAIIQSICVFSVISVRSSEHNDRARVNSFCFFVQSSVTVFICLCGSFRPVAPADGTGVANYDVFVSDGIQQRNSGLEGL